MVALLPSFQTLALFCSLAFAAPASHLATRNADAHTHQVRSLPNGLQLRSYHPRSTFEVYKDGIDHPLAKRGQPASFRDAAMSFIKDKVGDTAVWRSGFGRNSTTSSTFAYQEINGIPVANAVANAAINKDGKIVSFSHNFVKSNKVASAKPKISANAAVVSATKLLSGKPTGRETPLKYYVLDDDSLALTHAVELKLGNQHTVRAFVDAKTGDVHGMFDYTANAAFRVSPINSQDPSKDFELLTDPEDLQSSPQGWTTLNGQDTGELRGNNGVAFVGDADSGVGAESAPGEFDFNLNLDQDPTRAANVNASRTNAFFAVNTVHDIAFQYGFTEATFNFQEDNLGNGGAGGDGVQISVQDGSGTDNAQFTTLEDGQPGLMQMFLFTGNPEKDGALVNSVVVHEMTHGITSRLVGGGTGDCLQSLEAGGLGEGWSDAFAEWTEQTSGQIEDYEVGSFLFEGGIRKFAYSLDRQVNPLLFSDVAKLDEVHDIGEVMAQTLHVVNAALIEAKGFTADANTNPAGTGGNVIWMHLFIDSLSLLPCNPTFLDARAGWIQADVNRFNGDNACTLWTAFASMGLGPDASEGTDDFDVPASCGGNGGEVASTGTGSTSASNDSNGNGNAGAGTGGGRRGGRRGRGRGRNVGFAGRRAGKSKNGRAHKH